MKDFNEQFTVSLVQKNINIILVTIYYQDWFTYKPGGSGV